MLIIKLPFSSFWTVRHSFLQVVGIEIFICSTIVFLCMSCAALQSISRDMIFNNLKWSLMIFILSVMSSSCWARRNEAVKKLVKYIRKLHRILVLNNPTKVSSCILDYLPHLNLGQPACRATLRGGECKLWSSGKGKGKGSTRKVTQRSFIDYRLSIIDILSLELTLKLVATFPPPPPQPGRLFYLTNEQIQIRWVRWR